MSSFVERGEIDVLDLKRRDRTEIRDERAIAPRAERERDTRSLAVHAFDSVDRDACLSERTDADVRERIVPDPSDERHPIAKLRRSAREDRGRAAEREPDVRGDHLLRRARGPW